MALVPVLGAIYPRARGNLQNWTVGGCLASAIALLGLVAAAIVGPAWPLRETVFMLGITNGAYAVAAIGSMMELVGAGGEIAKACAWAFGARPRRLRSASAVSSARLRTNRALSLTSPALSYPGCSQLKLVCSSSRQAWRFGFIARRQEPRCDKVYQAISRSSRHRRSEIMRSRRSSMWWSSAAGRRRNCGVRPGQAGSRVLLLDRAGRIKPCGGAIPPRLIRDFDIPDHLLVARVNSARMVSPSDKQVDMPIDGGFVGMVDREEFDEWLRERAAAAARSGEPACSSVSNATKAA